MAHILRLGETASTNDEVMARALAGAADGLWVMADVQTAGRGRQGRVWQSPAGNLYCSTLVRMAAQSPPFQQLSFVAAVALQETLSAYVAGIHLKWPNDLLVKGKKLSGILLEGGFDKTGPFVVIGIGVNLAHFPDNVARPATSLAAEMTLPAPAPADVLTQLVETFGKWRRHWQHQGFSLIRDAWLRHATGLGERIDVRLGQETLSGLFAGLDEAGALLLALDSGAVRAIHAGEIDGI